MLETIYEKTGVLKYTKISQCNNGCDFTGDEKKLLEKQNVGSFKIVHSHIFYGNL